MRNTFWESTLFAKDFLNLDLETETNALEKVSGKQHGEVTLLKLQEAAQHSIGIPVQTLEVQAYRMTLDAWLNLLKIVESQMNAVLEQLIPLAEQTPYFEILLSLKGISVRLAALFIAETRELSNFRHYKQIEKLIGYNLRQTDSGQYSGARHMSHIGNRRLAWIVYKMTEEAAKYVPEVRMKFLRRQLKRRSYRKNIIASAPTLLKLIVAMVKENRAYTYNPDLSEELQELEQRYLELKAKKGSQQSMTKKAA